MALKYSFIFTFILPIILCFSANAQDLKWSQPQKIGERSFISDVIGQNGEGIFVVRKSARQPERNVTLEHYNKEMRLMHSKVFASGKGEYFAQILLLPAKLQVYLAVENQESKDIEFKVKTLDFNLNAVGNDSVLFHMPGTDFSDRKMQVFKPISQQQTLFLYTKQTMEIPSNYNYVVVDTGLSTIAAGEINFDIDNNYDIDNLAFTSTHVALLIRETVKKKVSKQGYIYYIAESKIGETNAKLTPLYNDSLTVTEGLLKADYLKNDIVFAGLYNLKDSTYAKGYFLRTHALDSDKTTTFNAPFPKRAVEEMSGKTTKVRGIYNLRSGDMILRKDGGVVLTSEEYEETREAVMDMNMYGVSQTNFRYYYYYENMLVLSINPNGSLDWHTVLRKEQVSVNDNGIYSSYFVSAMPDKLVYVYNDLSRKSWNLSLYEVNSDGVADNKIIIRAQDYESKLVPQYARQISYDEMIIPGIGTKGYVLLKVKL